VLVTGPTGSGKTNTLYSALQALNTSETNIMTAEDPVEFNLAGINQVQMKEQIGLNFAAALRSFLRQDPNIVLVGEIRDFETAEIAIKAALTGHLVLSTLHTNDAPSAITRLTEMGIEPFLVGSAVDCVLAQRLARRLCSKCKEPYEPTAEQLEKIGYRPRPDDPTATFFRPVGCSNCAKTGYKGRLALHEVMAMDDDIERMTVERASSSQISTVAIDHGMRVLREDGLLKASQGVTSLDEIFRVVA